MSERAEAIQGSKYTVIETPGTYGIDTLRIPELKKELQIFDYRDLTHHSPVARALANGARVAMYGGVWAAIKTEKRNSTGGSFFWEVKIPEDEALQVIPRPEEARPPTFGRPEDYIHYIDWTRHHPHFQKVFGNASDFLEIWANTPAYLHVIAYMKDTVITFPRKFVTSARHFESRYPDFPPIGANSFAIFWREEPFTRHFATFVGRYAHNQIHDAVTTLNFHEFLPPFDWLEFKMDIANGKIRIDLIDAILRDQMYEDSKAFSSHVQFILGPKTDKDPTVYIIRLGSLSANYLAAMFKKYGISVIIYPEAKDTKKVPGANLDQNLVDMRIALDEKFNKQKPLVSSRFPYITDWQDHALVPQILAELSLHGKGD